MGQSDRSRINEAIQQTKIVREHTDELPVARRCNEALEALKNVRRQLPDQADDRRDSSAGWREETSQSGASPDLGEPSDRDGERGPECG